MGIIFCLCNLQGGIILKAIALLSGGLDSVVSLLKAKEENEIILAITFDYGQRARINEIRASRNITKFLGIEHKVIELPFMQDLHSELMKDSNTLISNPWVPNRNGLFINIAAAYAENLNADLLICGFNREEAIIFPDNSRNFINAINEALHYSTMNHVQVKSYVDNLDKVEIVQEATRLGLDFRYIWSCYHGNDKPCGKCTSCLTNKKAFEKAGVLYSEDFIY